MNTIFFLLLRFKRYFLIIIFLNSCTFAFSQHLSKFQLSFQLQPELTFHKNDYAFRWTEKHTKNTFNIGLSSLLQYNFSNKFFLESGIGFISRKLKTTVFVDQTELPRPYNDSILITYETKSVSFRLLQIPFSLGFYLLKTEEANLFFKASYIPNFLLNTKYEVNNYPKFNKNYWLGHTINTSIGLDYQLNKKIILTSTLAYSLLNSVAKDTYLYSQDEKEIALTHKYLLLALGIKFNISKRN